MLVWRMHLFNWFCIQVKLRSSLLLCLPTQDKLQEAEREFNWAGQRDDSLKLTTLDSTQKDRCYSYIKHLLEISKENISLIAKEEKIMPQWKELNKGEVKSVKEILSPRSKSFVKKWILPSLVFNLTTLWANPLRYLFIWSFQHSNLGPIDWWHYLIATNNWDIVEM